MKTLIPFAFLVMLIACQQKRSPLPLHAEEVFDNYYLDSSMFRECAFGQAGMYTLKTREVPDSLWQLVRNRTAIPTVNKLINYLLIEQGYHGATPDPFPAEQLSETGGLLNEKGFRNGQSFTTTGENGQRIFVHAEIVSLYFAAEPSDSVRTCAGPEVMARSGSGARSFRLKSSWKKPNRYTCYDLFYGLQISVKPENGKMTSKTIYPYGLFAFMPEQIEAMRFVAGG